MNKLFIVGVAILGLAGCNSTSGAKISNETDQPLSFKIEKTGEKLTNWSNNVSPSGSISLQIPNHNEITLSAKYPSGFIANSLFTEDELKKYCQPSGDSYDCRFRFIDNEFKLVEKNLAEDFASIFSYLVAILGTVLLATTLFLFFRNRRQNSTEN